MRFDEKVGDFEMQQISSFDEFSENISVEYITVNKGFTAAILKVYIYPAPEPDFLAENPFADHYEDQKSLLLKIYPEYYDVEEGKIKIGQPMGPQTGKMLRFKMKESDFFSDKEVYEKLYLFQHGKWILKYRVTNPVSNDEVVSERVGKFMHLLHWPELEE
jgi:hypothetical protein